MLSLNTGYPIPTPQQAISAGTENAEDSDDTDYSDIDLDFIGG